MKLLRVIVRSPYFYDRHLAPSFAAVRGKPMRLLVQAVGPRVTSHYDRPWAASEKRETRLVVIGLKGLDRAVITRMLSG